jgi:hypothetical protein
MPFRCEVCDYETTRRHDLDRHYSTKKHRTNIILRQVPLERHVRTNYFSPTKQHNLINEATHIGETQVVTALQDVGPPSYSDTAYSDAHNEVPFQTEFLDDNLNFSESLSDSDYGTESDDDHGVSDEEFCDSPSPNVFLEHSNEEDELPIWFDLDAEPMIENDGDNGYVWRRPFIDNDTNNRWAPFTNELEAYLMTMVFGQEISISLTKMEQFLCILKRFLPDETPTKHSFHTAIGKIVNLSGTAPKFINDILYIRLPRDILGAMFSDPIIARAIVRGPQKSVKCKELYHSPEFHRRVPRLAFLHEGMAWYAGDSFFGLTENTLFVILHFEDHDAVIIQTGKQLNDVPMRMPAVQLLGRLIIRGNLYHKARRPDYTVRDVVHVGLAIFTDETSGNISKRWNHFETCSLHVMNMPKTFCDIHFLGTYRSKNWQDLMIPVIEDIINMQDGIVVYDVSSGLDIVVVATLFTVLADNPRANEVCGTAKSARATFACRLCESKKTDPNMSNRRTKLAAMMARQHLATLTTRQTENFTAQTGYTRNPVRYC